MDITEEHIEAIRRVLNQQVSLKEVATDYPPTLKVMTGVTILQGADVQDDGLIKPRGMYGYLLHELAIAPGIPADGWPMEDGFFVWPTWYDEATRSSLVERARRYGFHQTKQRQGHGLIFVGHPAFTTLLREDESFVRMCRTWYNEARAAIVKRREEEATRQRARQRQEARKRRRELRQRPKLCADFAKIVEEWHSILANPRYADFAGISDLTQVLNNLVERYNPES